MLIIKTKTLQIARFLFLERLSGTAALSIDPASGKGTWLSVSGNVGFGYTGSELSGATYKGGAGYTVIFMQPWDPKKHGSTINLPPKPQK